MDERKLKLYQYMLTTGKITLDQIPEPYYTAIAGHSKEQTSTE